MFNARFIYAFTWRTDAPFKFVLRLCAIVTKKTRSIEYGLVFVLHRTSIISFSNPFVQISLDCVNASHSVDVTESVTAIFLFRLFASTIQLGSVVFSSLTDSLSWSLTELILVLLLCRMESENFAHY